MYKTRIYFLFSLIVCIKVIHCQGLDSAEEEEEDDWFNFSPEVTDEDAVANEGPKRWTKEGICDHDLFTSIILKLLLDIQPTMKIGDPELKLPPMDPLSIPQVKMNQAGPKGEYFINMDLKDILVKDLSKFNITGITSDLDTLASNVSVFLNSAGVSGKYHLKGVGKFGIISIPIFGNGDFFIKAKEVECFIYSKFSMLPNTSIILQEFDFGVKIKRFDVDFTGLLFSRGGSKIISRILDANGHKIYNRIEPVVHNKIRSRVIAAINKLLHDWEYDEEMLMKMISQSVNCLFG